MPTPLWFFSRAFIKVLVKALLFLVNFCCLCTCDFLKAKREQKRKKLTSGKDGKRLYTSDIISIVANPTNNPIMNCAYDLDKYSKICAGVFLICEGEVLLLQRNSRNNDLMFDVPGGNADMEDFPELYKQLYGSYPKSYQQDYGASPSRWFHFSSPFSRSSSQTEPAFTANTSQPKSDIEAQHHLSKHKKPLYPQIPLYDSFYFADLFGSQFQSLGYNSYGSSNPRYIKRKQLERLHEQSIRHTKHGFGFDSGMWTAAVRETREEIGTFPDQLTPLGIFNIYRGWSYQDDDDDDDGDESDSNSDDSSEEDSFLMVADEESKLIKKSKKQDTLNLSLLSNGKIITQNFRRYTLYLCSITPTQRNLLTNSIQLSEEHCSYGWFPLCLILPMNNTTISTFSHFVLHPWLRAFIEQYSAQFDKIARKQFWVGYNRHFAPPEDFIPLLEDKSQDEVRNNIQEYTTNGDEKSANNHSPVDYAFKLLSEPTVDSDKAVDEVTIEISSENRSDKVPKTCDTENTISLVDAPNDNDDEDDDDLAEDEDQEDGNKKKKKGKKGKKGDKKKNKEKKASKKALKEATVTVTTHTTTAPQENVGSGDQYAYIPVDEETVDFDPRDVFISVFLPLVKKHINPSVYA